MVGSRGGSGSRARRSGLAAVVVVVLFGGTAYAQAAGDTLAAQPADGQPRVAVQSFEITAASLIPAAPPSQQQPRTVPPSPGRRHRSLTRKVVGGALGAFGGFLGGGFLGAKLERPCNCDDPGLQGFIIGAPIGAVVGGILGAKFF